MTSGHVALLVIGIYFGLGLVPTGIMIGIRVRAEKGKFTVLTLFQSFGFILLWPILSFILSIEKGSEIGKFLNQTIIFETKKSKLARTLFESKENGNGFHEYEGRWKI